MSELTTILAEKQIEASQMLDLVTSFSNGHGNIVKSSMMKSAQVMMLYSAVESMTYLCFERIHEMASRVAYTDLSPNFQDIWADYYFTSFSDSKKKQAEHLAETISGSLSIPSLSTYLKRRKLFSGNLDSRKINELLRCYGVRNISGAELKDLKFVKDKRNALAHGECMFKEGCRAITERELRFITNNVFVVIGKMVHNVEDFVKNKKYLKH